MNALATSRKDSESLSSTILKSGGRSRARTYDPLIKRYRGCAVLCRFSESEGQKSATETLSKHILILNTEKL